MSLNDGIVGATGEPLSYDGPAEKIPFAAGTVAGTAASTPVPVTEAAGCYLYCC